MAGPVLLIKQAVHTVGNFPGRSGVLLVDQIKGCHIGEKGRIDFPGNCFNGMRGKSGGKQVMNFLFKE